MQNVITERYDEKESEAKHTMFSVQAVRCIPISVTMVINFSWVEIHFLGGISEL